MLRSLICIGLVYALASSDGALLPPGPAGVPAPHAGAQPRGSQLAETTKALVQQGVNALGEAARDRCLAAPQECLATLRKINGPHAP